MANIFNIGNPILIGSLSADPGTASNGTIYYNTTSNVLRQYINGAWATIGSGTGAGTVTSVSVVSANGFTGTVATATTTPAITLTGTLSGDVTGTLNSNALTATSNSTLTTLSALSLPGSQVTGNISGDAANVTGVVAIANGGTGQSAKQAAFDVLSPLASAGDTLYYTGTHNVNLPIGSNGQVYTVVSGLPAWQTATTGANTSLSNLSSVAINASLLPGTDDSINLGSPAKSWAAANIHILEDASGVTSVDAYGRLLEDSSGATAVDFGNRELIDSSAAIQLSWSTSGVELNQLTASTVPYLSASKILTSSAVTPTELGYVSGVTSSIQTQLNGKQATGNYITALTGDATASGPGSAALTLATVNSNVGSFGSSTSIPSFTVNAKGLITAASGNAVVAPAGTLSGTTLNSSVVSSSLTSLGIQAQALNMGSFQINALASPSLSTDAATKGYVDAAISGLTWKGPVAAYAASNVPLTGSTPLVIDGYTVLNNDLLLLGNQTTASQNGEYSAAITGGTYVLTANGLPDAIGDAWLVNNGTLYSKSAFVATAAVPAAAFTEFAGPQALIFNAPLSISGNTVSISQATTSTNGYLSSTDWNTFNNKQPAGNYITALTGDATASGPGSAAITLATVNSNVGSFGSSTSIPSFTVNAKGLITAVSSNVVVAPAGTLSGTTLNSTVVSSSLTSFGSSPTLSSPTLSGTVTVSGLTASQAVFTNASSQLISNAITGTGNVVMSASPTLTGTISAAAANLSGALGANGGITSTGALTVNANAGASAVQIESSSVQRSTDGTNYVTEKYVDSTTITASTSTTLTNIGFASGSFKASIVDYYLIEATTGNVQVGQLYVGSDGTITSLSDNNTNTNSLGISFSAAMSGANVVITATKSGANNATMRADQKLFRV